MATRPVTAAWRRAALHALSRSALHIPLRALTSLRYVSTTADSSIGARGQDESAALEAELARAGTNSGAFPTEAWRRARHALHAGMPHTAAAMLRDAVSSLEAEGGSVELPSRSEAALRLCYGTVLQVRGALADAKHQYTKALELMPTCKQAHAALGDIARLQHYSDVAATHFEAALKIDPHYKRAQLGLALLFHHLRWVFQTSSRAQQTAGSTEEAGSTAVIDPGPIASAIRNAVNAKDYSRLPALPPKQEQALARLLEHATKEWPISMQLRSTAIHEQLERIAADTAMSLTRLQRLQRDPSRKHQPTESVSYGEPIFPPSTAELNSDFSVVWLGSNADEPKLEYVAADERLESIYLETDKVMLEINAPEAGVITEFVIPSEAQEKSWGNISLPVPDKTATQRRRPVARLLAASVRPARDWAPAEGAIGPPSPPSPAPASSAGRITQTSTSSQSKTISVGKLADILAGAARATVLTGAGISSASGLRTRKELWTTLSREAHVGVWHAAEDKWKRLWTLVRDFLVDAGSHCQPQPNIAHSALAQLERGGLLTSIITQNVDNLHQAAGSRTVIELHGTLHKTHCDTCGKVHGSAHEHVMLHLHEPVVHAPACTAPGCNGLVRPSVVLFGELVPAITLQAAAEQAVVADVMLVIGTSADVSPAADLPRLAAHRGAKVIEIKRTESLLSSSVAYARVAAPSEEVLPQLVEYLGMRL